MGYKWILPSYCAGLDGIIGVAIDWWSLGPLSCRLYQEDPEESVRQCNALLDEQSLDAAVRVGDVYALLIEHYAHIGNYQQVLSTVSGGVLLSFRMSLHLQ